MPARPLRRLLLLLALAGAGGAAAECRGPSLLEGLDAGGRATLAAASAATPYGAGVLWTATRGDARLLVVGTLHLPDARHGPLAAALATAIREADLALLEATPAEEAAMAAAVAARPDLALLPEGATLRDRLGPEAWSVAAAAAAARGLAPEAAARLRPWLLMMLLSAPPCAASGGGAGLDRLIQREAEGADVPQAALEPWDRLFRLFEEAGPAREAEMLRLSLLPDAAAEGLLLAQADAYFAGRTAEIWALARLGPDLRPPARGAETAAWDALETALLARRNVEWVPVIEAAAADASRVVVVAGASHLPGESGLLRLLAARGWTLAPIDPGACCEGVWQTP